MAHDQEVVGSNPDTVYWMDVSVASYYIIEKYRNKGSQMGHTKKILKKKKFTLVSSLRITSGKTPDEAIFKTDQFDLNFKEA